MEFSPEGASTDREPLGRSGEIAPAFHDDLLDVFQLHLVPLTFQCAIIRIRRMMVPGPIEKFGNNVGNVLTVADLEFIHVEVVDGKPFDDVFHLPDISRPGVLHEERKGDVKQHLDGSVTTKALHGFRQQMGCNGGDVFTPFPQGRKLQVENIESIEEVLPEFSLPNLMLQVTVGCGDDPNVDLDRV